MKDQTHTDSLNVVMCVFTASTKLKPAVRTLSEGEEGMSLTAAENLLSARLWVMASHITASSSPSEGR